MWSFATNPTYEIQSDLDSLGLYPELTSVHAFTTGSV
jgi:hypothetical protein